MQTGDTPARTGPLDERSQDSAINRSQTLRTFAGCRILVVDDNIINCEVAVQMLQKSGCRADAANTARNAIDMHARHRYDLILMDCQMPGMDGYQATAMIRAAEVDGTRTMIIGWTSTTDADERTRCFGAGMDDLIAKPIRRDAICEIIARWASTPISSQPVAACNSPDNDLAGIQQRFGPDFPELADLYQADTSKRIDAMRKAVGEGNIAQLAAIAHILGSSCASIGALRLAAKCRELEIHCKAENTQNFVLLLNEIQDEYIETNAIIRTLLQSATL